MRAEQTETNAPALALAAWSPPWRRDDPVPSRLELCWAGGLIAALVLGMYLHMADQLGFWFDDWQLVAGFHFKAGSLGDLPDLWGDVSAEYDRLGAAAVMFGMETVVGDSETGAGLFGVLFGLLITLLLYLALRLVGIRIAVAGAIAGMFAVLPFIDEARFWFTAFGTVTSAGCFYLGGLSLALLALRAGEPGRERTGLHVCSLLLYAGAVLTYEMFAPAIALSILIYLPIAVRERAVRRWGADLAVLAVALVIGALRVFNERSGDLTPSRVIDRLGEILSESADVFGRALPADGLLVGPLGITLALVVGAGVALAISRGGELGDSARLWLLIAAGGLTFAVLGLIPLVAAAEGSHPTWQGIGGRVGIAAAPGAAILLVALVALTAIGLASLARSPLWATPLAVGALLLTAVPLIGQEFRNQQDWVALDRELDRQLAVARAALPRLEPGDAVVTFRNPIVLPGNLAGFLAIFRDQENAYRLAYGEDSISAHTFFPGGRCLPDGVELRESPLPVPLPPRVYPYGRLYFLDVSTGEAVRISGPRQCVRALARLSAVPTA